MPGRPHRRADSGRAGVDGGRGALRRKRERRDPAGSSVRSAKGRPWEAPSQPCATTVAEETERALRTEERTAVYDAVVYLKP